MIEVHPTNRSEVAWSSWLAALGYALGASTGPVLEIGCGHFSTPFLHEYCRAAWRMLWSVESDSAWRAMFVDRYESDLHRFGYPSSHQIPTDARFGVVFVDDSPGGENRANWVRNYLPISDYVVVHDYHRENEAAIAPLLAGVNHRVFSDYEPPTLLASQLHAVP